MKKVILPILLLHLTMMVNAATYYFSSASGDDSRTSAQAQSTATPWKTIGKLNSIMSTLQPGDMVLFKRGDSFDGTINVTVSGAAGLPITFSAYGVGGSVSRPVINGFATLGNWNQSRSSVWEADFAPAGGSTNMVVANNQQQVIGRYPNSNTNNKGWLNITGVSGSTQISSTQLPSSPDWTGGEVVIRQVRWVIDRSTITSQSGSTLNFKASSGYAPALNYGFFIQNHTGTLDQQGEWFFDKTRNKLQMYFGANNPTAYSVKGSVTATLLSISSQSYINVSNMIFTGANANAISLSNANYVTINNCDITFSGGNAVIAQNSAYLTLTNSNVNNTNNNALYLKQNCPNAIIRGNLVKNTAIIPGMGQSDADTYQAVIVRGDNDLVEYNEIDSSGFNPLQFRGDYATIKNNFINYFDYVKDDGAGIYNGLGSMDNTVYHSGLIIGNIILNGVGAMAGTKDSLMPQSAGIYLDDNANHLTVTGNTIANCAMAGINNHNGHELTITGNTMYNNTLTQFQEVRDYISPNPVRNCVVSNNIMFSRTATQLASTVTSVQNDIAQFGRFDSNHYCRPIDDNYVMYYAYYDAGTQYTKYDNLAGWEAKFGVDGTAKASPVKLPASFISSTSGVNLYNNGYYTKDVSGVYPFSSLNDVATTWLSSKLDAGTLQVSSTKYTYDNNFLVNLPVNAVTAGKSYMLSFSLLGSTNDRSMDVYLRKIGSPYTALTQKNKVSVTTNRTDMQFGLTAASGDDQSCIMLEYNQVNGPIWVDNVQLQEATVTQTNPDDYILFQYNATKKVKTITLNDTYYDVNGISYTGKVTLQPFASLVLTKQASSSQFKITTDASVQAINLQGSLVNSSASLSSTSSASLNWKVDNQRRNTVSYEVERSSDAVHFTTIGNTSVKKEGSTVSYDYSDAAPAFGKNYYRIKQYDDKGVYAFSKMVIVNNISFKINPNPAQNVAHLMFDKAVGAADHLGKDVIIRNGSGVVVKTLQLPATDNLNKIDIPVSSLIKGMYTVAITSEGQTFSKSFMKD